MLRQWRVDIVERNTLGCRCTVKEVLLVGLRTVNAYGVHCYNRASMSAAMAAGFVVLA